MLRVRNGPKRIAQQAAVPQDTGHQVIEIMGNPAGQSPDRFHLLRVAQTLLRVLQCFFGSSALRDVLDADQDHLGVIQLTRANQQDLMTGARKFPRHLEIVEGFFHWQDFV